MTSRPAPARGKWARFLWGAVVLLVAAACDRSSPTEPDAPRAACGPWPPQVNSPYDLPYPTGTAYVVNQGNCTPGTHAPGTRDGYAYDFGMPIGSDVVAARGGIVEEIEERYFDGNGALFDSNYVLVRHSDGEASVYFHLTHDGVLVELGEFVGQGELIAKSGFTGGATRPHLHFGVLGSAGLTIPVTFRNTIPHPNGLEQGVTYPAF